MSVATWLAIIAMLACRAPHSASGAPAAQPPTANVPDVPTAATKTERQRQSYTLADVQFMQGMIVHHAQALEMTALIAGRSTRPDIKLLGERISVSQRDEIAMMRRWLQQRGEEFPDSAAHGGHHAGGAMMPGMLTPQEMEQLAKATGTEFDRAFLRLMIRHHEGALTMVATLFASPGAGHDTEIFFFASDVDGDQRAEISRMRSMLSALSPSDPPPLRPWPHRVS